MRMPEDDDLKMGKLIVKRSDLEYPSKVEKEDVEERTEDEEETEPQYVEEDMGERMD